MTYLARPKIELPGQKTNAIGLTLRDYEGALSTLCAGCGHDSITAALVQALWEMSLRPEMLIKMSGIGCSSKTPAYFVHGAHGFNSVHGRMPSVATGAMAAAITSAGFEAEAPGGGFYLWVDVRDRLGANAPDTVAWCEQLAERPVHALDALARTNGLCVSRHECAKSHCRAADHGANGPCSRNLHDLHSNLRRLIPGRNNHGLFRHQSGWFCFRSIPAPNSRKGDNSGKQ